MSIRSRSAAVTLVTLLAMPRFGAAATLQPHTVSAWDVYVTATEARIAGELGARRGFLVSDFGPEASSVRGRVRGGEVAIARMPASRRRGEAVAVQDGLISHWRGSIFLPGVELEPLLKRLQHPNEQGPHQPDVLAVRVLERQPDHLRLYIRMTRSSVVTVTYDTEHLLDYRRHGQTRASSRSVSTRILEVDDAGAGIERAKREGHDRGFLWRLNSYWRYEQVEGGVIVELESLTLSRSVPRGLGTVVEPVIDRIARESIAQTLENIRQTYASRPAPAVARRA